MDSNSLSIRNSLIQGIQENAGITKSIGIALLIIGFLAVCAPVVAGVSITVVVGLLLLVAGIGQCILAFRVDAFGRGLFVLIMGLLTLLVGIYMSFQPAAALVSITFFLAIYFVVTGIVEILTAIRLRPAQGWNWMLVSAIVTFLLGMMIWLQFPLSGLWAIGVLFGVKMMFSGATLLSLGSAAKKLAGAAESE